MRAARAARSPVVPRAGELAGVGERQGQKLQIASLRLCKPVPVHESRATIPQDDRQHSRGLIVRRELTCPYPTAARRAKNRIQRILALFTWIYYVRLPVDRLWDVGQSGKIIQ